MANSTVATPAEMRVAEVTKELTRGWAFTPLKGKLPLMKEWQKAPPSDVEGDA